MLEKEVDLQHYFRDLAQPEREFLSHARGRIVDIGAGAGQCSLYLQTYGHEVIALDKSSGAVHLCQDRGVKHCLYMDFQIIGLRNSTADTILVLGGHLGGTASSVAEVKAILMPC